MRILFATNYRVGQTGEFAHIALQRMGHDLVSITPVVDAPDQWITVDPQLDILAFYDSLDVKPDLFFLVESSTGSPFFPKNIDLLSIPTAVWLYDNYLNFRWNKEVIALFDYAFFAQTYRILQARDYGAPHVYWLPFAADEQFHKNFHVKRDIDIGYVGSITGQKQKYFAALEQDGLKVVTNDRYFSYDDIGQFYSRCKIVYNILARRDMNVRTFEASAAGAVVVNQAWIDEGCFDIFVEGESMLFHNFDDAAQICRALLADDQRREQIGAAAEAIVMNGHTYRHRMEYLFNIVSNGVTAERKARAADFRAPIGEALTCMHRDFKWLQRGQAKMTEAYRRSFVGSLFYLLKYAWWRIREKIEKLRWSMGKAPV